MPNSTMTMAIDGEVSPDTLAHAITRFHRLLDALTAEVSPGLHLDWLIDDVQHGSTVATVRGQSTAMEAIEHIADAYLAVGRALAEGREIPFSPRVAREAEALAEMLDGSMTSIRFETEVDDATVIAAAGVDRRPAVSAAYGAVDGRIQPYPSTDSLRFTLYDAFHARAVSCYLHEGQQDYLRNAWGRRATVEGWVTRDSATGRPLSVRRIQRISLMAEVVPGSAMRAARGIAPLGPGDPSAVDVIRRLRDDW